MGTPSDPKSGEGSISNRGSMPGELQGQLGQKLREAYSELVSEPVPDRFVQLLQALKQKETPGGGQS